MSAPVPFALASLLSLTFAVAQSSVAGPYTSDSFEAPRYALGTLPGVSYMDGQDGWLLLDSFTYPPALAAATVQGNVVRTGQRAVRWNAAQMTPGCYGELRRNAMFSLTTGVLEFEMDFLITSSSSPSQFWEFYTQPTPNPQSCQMRWFIGADGHVEFFTSPARQLVVTNYIVSKDVWHHARTVVDIFGNHTEIHIDGDLVGTGTPIGVYANLPDHGFVQIAVDGAGNDAFYFDQFTVRERLAPHGLSVDLTRLPINTRSLMTFHLAGGSTLAGRDHLLLASISGTSPGVPLQGVTLPLAFDGFTGLILDSLAGPALTNFLGTLNAAGDATASFDTMIPVPAGLLGLELHFAWLTLSPMDHVSEAVKVRVVQ